MWSKRRSHVDHNREIAVAWLNLQAAITAACPGPHSYDTHTAGEELKRCAACGRDKTGWPVDERERQAWLAK